MPNLYHLAVSEYPCETAQTICEALMPLESLRDDLSLIRVLHDAVTLYGIADMGPVLPLLSSTPPEHHAKIGHVARELLALERNFARARPSTRNSSQADTQA